MSNTRADKAGFAKEVQEKLAGKFDSVEAAKALRWIRLLKPKCSISAEITAAAEKIPSDMSTVDMNALHENLCNGLALGYLVACLDPTALKLGAKTWQVASNAMFETSRQRERIGMFLDFCAKYGVSSNNVFQTDQLYEKTNLTQVVICLSQLGVEAQSKPGYSGPQDYWMKKHQEHKRDFTEEQLRSGDGVIGLQMGTNKMANASGVSFGAQRHINDSH